MNRINKIKSDFQSPDGIENGVIRFSLGSSLCELRAHKSHGFRLRSASFRLRSASFDGQVARQARALFLTEFTEDTEKSEFVLPSAIKVQHRARRKGAKKVKSTVWLRYSARNL